MKRAAILIGVDKTGGLPKLNDAAKGARRMEQWALGQEMDPVIVLTDEGGKPVEARHILKAIKGIVDKGTIEQLFVYFAGHGTNLGFAERWLLTDAPDDPNAAVNLNGSAERAHYCGIPHVVFISDACRTAAPDIKAQGVVGSIVFPNDTGGGPEHSVDRFWACLVGNPAAEVRDPAVPASEYQAIYTGELLDALAGKRAEVTEAEGDGAVVRPKPLKRFMHSAMAQRLKNLNLHTKLIQVPDARITSDEGAWVSRVASGGKGMGFLGSPPVQGATYLESISSSLLRSAVAGRSLQVESILTRGVQGAQPLIDAASRSTQPFGPAHFETGCGFKLRGARFVEAVSKRSRAEVLSVAACAHRNHRSHAGERSVDVRQRKWRRAARDSEFHRGIESRRRRSGRRCIRAFRQRLPVDRVRRARRGVARTPCGRCVLDEKRRLQARRAGCHRSCQAHAVLEGSRPESRRVRRLRL